MRYLLLLFLTLSTAGCASGPFPTDVKTQINQAGNLEADDTVGNLQTVLANFNAKFFTDMEGALLLANANNDRVAVACYTAVMSMRPYLPGGAQAPKYIGAVTAFQIIRDLTSEGSTVNIGCAPLAASVKKTVLGLMTKLVSGVALAPIVGPLAVPISGAVGAAGAAL